MNFKIFSFPFRTVPVQLREKLAMTDEQRNETASRLAELYQCESVVLATCNRVEISLAWPKSTNPIDISRQQIAEFLSQKHQTTTGELTNCVNEYQDREAVRHLSRVAASLDSLVVGEGQILAQVKTAFEAAKSSGNTSAFFNALYPHALRVAKRVRTETGLAKGHVSISSVAVDFARQVFDRFDDKSVLVIGAGKMAGLTLKHLQNLRPKEIVLINRSIEKANQMAGQCHGKVLPWEQLALAIKQADVILSATGSQQAIVTKSWFAENIMLERKRWPLVILDIAVPRDFDPDIHNGSEVCLFNVDDLTKVRDQMLDQRKKYIAPSEEIVEQETTKFFQDWERRRSGPVIKELTLEFDRVRNTVVQPLLAKWNGKLTAEEKQQLEYAFLHFQNQLLHGPIAALQDASKSGEQRTMLDTIKKLFRLEKNK